MDTKDKIQEGIISNISILVYDLKLRIEGHKVVLQSETANFTFLMQQRCPETIYRRHLVVLVDRFSDRLNGSVMIRTCQLVTSLLRNWKVEGNQDPGLRNHFELGVILYRLINKFRRNFRYRFIYLFICGLHNFYVSNCHYAPSND
jgi:hypothetical protein